MLQTRSPDPILPSKMTINFGASLLVALRIEEQLLEIFNHNISHGTDT